MYGQNKTISQKLSSKWIAGQRCYEDIRQALSALYEDG